MILHMLIAMIAGWIQDHQQQVIEYLREDNRVLKAQLGGRRLRLTETERRRLATLAYPLGRPRVTEEIEQLVVRMAEENATWGYRRIQGALANPGHSIDAITVRNILRRHHMEPAPQRRKPGMSWTQFLQAHGEVLAATFPHRRSMACWRRYGAPGVAGRPLRLLTRRLTGCGRSGVGRHGDYRRDARL